MSGNSPLEQDGNRDVGACLTAPGSREPDPQAVPALTGFDPSRVETNPFLVDAIDEAITEAIRFGKEMLALQIAEPMWAGFKNSVPRKERRKREGSRFVNAYRRVPISIHPEWDWGWRLVIVGEDPMEISE